MVSACAASFIPRDQFAIVPISTLAALGECTRAEILTFTSLALHADPSGFCFPGRERLAAITGLPENRITKATTSLEKKGFIRKEQPDPFHVHYYLLTPPATEPIKPKAKCRPPLKVRPVPAAQPAPPATPNPCHQRHQLVPPTAPLTDQGTYKEKERAAPETAPPEVAAPAPDSPPPLSQPHGGKKKPTPAPDTMPDSWIDTAIETRPDLTADQISRSAARFLDYHRGKGSEYRDWLPIWRIWISKERIDSPRSAGQRPQATQPASRYQRPDQEKAPPDKATLQAIAAGEQRRIAMTISCGIDPATGLKATPPVAATAPAAAPPLDSPPVVGLYKPLVEPPLTAEDQQRQRQIADLAAHGLTLADAKAARNPVKLAPTPPTPARRYSPEQQRQFIQLAAQGLTPQQIRARMRLD